ncbi:hypothetical protein BG005_000780 [Podila minutissima]|nr:hypothetical protein BG005_000780 [Podila minutissima]
MALHSPWDALEKRASPPFPPPHVIRPHDAIAQAPPKPSAKPKPPPAKPPVVKPPVVPPVVPPVSSSSSSVPPISSISSTGVGSSSSDTATTTAPTHPSGAESAGGPVTTTPANNTGLIAGIAAGAVVVVLVIGGLVLRSRRRRNRAARDAEEYQQRAMMNKYSEHSGSSMNSGYGMDGFGSSATLSRVMGKQPDWFAQKSPLEYYRQVPPLTELQKQTPQPQPSPQQRPYLKHETSATSAHSSASTSSYQGSRSLKKSSSQTELIPLTPTGASPKALPSPHKPYQQQQYQQPRLSTNLRSPTSPTSPTYLGLSPYNNRPQQSPFPTLSTSPISSPPLALPSTNSLYTYHPPPPSTSPVSPSPSKPSAGFYDFLMDDEDGKSDSKAKNKSISGSSKDAGKPESPTGSSPTTRAPPPVPRSTRPISVISTSSLKLKESGDLMLDGSAPAVPALPKSS